MKIGELARATATAPETIRYYEREGLLPEPARSGANYRHYGPAHQARLALICRCRALDMSVDEVRALLRVHDAPKPDPGCAEVNALLDAHLGHVRARLAELRALEQELLRLQARCSGDDAAACGILQSLRQDDAGSPAKPLHLRRTHG